METIKNFWNKKSGKIVIISFSVLILFSAIFFPTYYVMSSNSTDITNSSDGLLNLDYENKLSKLKDTLDEQASNDDSVFVFGIERKATLPELIFSMAAIYVAEYYPTSDIYLLIPDNWLNINHRFNYFYLFLEYSTSIEIIPLLNFSDSKDFHYQTLNENNVFDAIPSSKKMDFYFTDITYIRLGTMYIEDYNFFEDYNDVYDRFNSINLVPDGSYSVNPSFNEDILIPRLNNYFNNNQINAEKEVKNLLDKWFNGEYLDQNELDILYHNLFFANYFDETYGDKRVNVFGITHDQFLEESNSSAINLSAIYKLGLDIVLNDLKLSTKGFDVLEIMTKIDTLDATNFIGKENIIVAGTSYLLDNASIEKDIQIVLDRIDYYINDIGITDFNILYKGHPNAQDENINQFYTLLDQALQVAGYGHINYYDLNKNIPMEVIPLNEDFQNNETTNTYYYYHVSGHSTILYSFYDLNNIDLVTEIIFSSQDQYNKYYDHFGSNSSIYNWDIATI